MTEKLFLITNNSLMSFAKYFELLLYSPILCRLSTELCTHTAPAASSATGDLPASRFNITRHFSIGSRVLNINTSQTPAVYELRLPPLHIARSFDNDSSALKLKQEKDGDMSENVVEGVEERRVLRREMKVWWQILAEHIDKLVRMNTLISPLLDFD